MERTEADWRQVWHQYVGGSGPKDYCQRCGLFHDRAIHDEKYARSNGHEWIGDDTNNEERD